MSSDLGISLHNLRHHTSANALLSKSDMLDSLPQHSAKPKEICDSIKQEYDLLERYTEIEKVIHSWILNQNPSSLELNQIHKGELARVIRFIEQVQRLEHQITLAQVSVTACYYQKHLKSVAYRARERLADLEEQKERLLIKLAYSEDTSSKEEGQSRAGLPEDFQQLRQLGEVTPQQASDAPTGQCWIGEVPHSMTNRIQVNERNKFSLPSDLCLLPQCFMAWPQKFVSSSITIVAWRFS